MHKTWLIAWQRLQHVIGHWAYWLGLFSPLVALLMALGVGGLTTWAIAGQKSAAPPAPDAVKVNPTPFAEAVGYVDEARLITRLPAGLPAGKFIRYTSEAEARAAAQKGQIAGYYVIPPDYVAGGRAAYYAPGVTLFLGTDSAFQNLLAANLVVTDDDALAWRAAHPLNLSYQHAADAPRTVPGMYTLVQALLGALIIFFFANLLASVGPYWLAFLVAERSQGMLEISLTSASPGQFVSGKLAAALALMTLESLLPMLWVVAANEAWRSLQATLAANSGLWQLIYQELPPFSGEKLAAMALVTVGGLLAYSALYIIGGVLLQTYEAVGAVNNMATLALLGLLFALFGVLTNPTGPAALGLSLFPLTAPVIMPVRLVVEAVPLWQVGLSAGLMLVTALGALRVAIRLFQLRQWWQGAAWRWR